MEKFTDVTLDDLTDLASMEEKALHFHGFRQIPGFHGQLWINKYGQVGSADRYSSILNKVIEGRMGYVHQTVNHNTYVVKKRIDGVLHVIPLYNAMWVTFNKNIPHGYKVVLKEPINDIQELRLEYLGLEKK